MKFTRAFFIGLLLAAFIFSTVLPVQAAPAGFQKITPAQGAVNLNTTTVTFTWSASSPGATYYLCVTTNNNQKCPKPKWRNAGTGTSFTVSNLSLNTTYYWQVRADDASGSTEADNRSWWSFNTNQAAPAAFNKVAPANNGTGLSLTPTLTWTSSAGAASYEYCIDTVPGNTCEDAWRTAGNATSIQVAGLQYEQTYYWQVRSRNVTGTVEANQGLWYNFRTQILPAADFVKISSTQGAAGQPLNMYLYWSPSLNAEQYEYCLKPAAQAPCTSSDWVNVNLNTNAAVDLTGNYETTYLWQVRALRTVDGLPTYTMANDDGGWTFTTFAEATLSQFSKVVPTDASTNQMHTPWLVWTSSTGAAGYEYCLEPGTVTECTSGWVPVADANTSVHLTTPLDFGATYSWQVRATGGAEPLDANASDWWTFTTLPEPPSVTAAPEFTMLEDTSLNSTIVPNNPGGSVVVFSLYGARPDGSFTLRTNGEIQYTPPLNYNGAVTFQFRISDGVNGYFGPYTATINITPVNDAPVIEPIADYRLLTGTTWGHMVAASDPDSVDTSLTYSIVGIPPVEYDLSIDPVTGSLTCAPTWAPTLVTPYTVTVRVSDGTLSATQTFNITVEAAKIHLPLIRK